MDDYITVVEVDDPTSKDTNHMERHQPVKRNNSIQDSSFITVLSINDVSSLPATTSVIHTNAAEDTNHSDPPEVETVHVYRLPGERLGFGLKFQGGTRSNERVQRLFIQSCAKDSPASRVAASWGYLREGDEIVSIDGRAVCEMTRIDCVRFLKDNVAIKLVVRNGFGQIPVSGDASSEEESRSTKQTPPPPPPVPPRKLVKRRQLKDGKMTMMDDKSFTPPPDAEYYINLFSDENSLKAAGSESDDTASTISTISTVIDKFSIGSNYSSETDLSNYASLNGTSVMNKTELAKVLKPFTMLEKEFKITETSQKTDEKPRKITSPPSNNYENIELKVEKHNVYENVELKSKDTPDGLNKAHPPKPKPRQTAIVEPKKRSIIPTPRKANGGKQESQETTESSKSEENKLMTKIPKAIAAVFGSSSSPKAMERSKTESELKLNQHSKSITDLRKQCELFLESEVRSSRENLSVEKQAEDSKASKSRIPIVLTPKKSLEAAIEPPPKIETILIKPRTMLQKQKSETDLKLTSYRPKDQRPTNLPILKSTTPGKASLQRSNSADSKSKESPSPKTPEKTLIPVLNLDLASPTRIKGPKPKPPERVQSLGKTQIPKLSLIGSPNTHTHVIVTQPEATIVPVTPPTPTMQTFKQHTPPPQNREIRFKIQTYEEKEREKDLFTDVNGNEEPKMPSLFDLVRKNSPPSLRKDEPKLEAEPNNQQQSKNVEKNPESPVIVKKCIKISGEDREVDTYYSSSSSGSDDDDEGCGDEKEYEIEDGEKLGPPEVVNGPGPSEAYFNMYWHSNMLPTIGEVEEELSSLEVQSACNGPIVIINDVGQQQLYHSKHQQGHQTRTVETSIKQKEAFTIPEKLMICKEAKAIQGPRNASNDSQEKLVSTPIASATLIGNSNINHVTSIGDQTKILTQAVNGDSEIASDKITPLNNTDLTTTTTPPSSAKECSSNDSNNNASFCVIEGEEQYHQRQVSAINATDSEFSIRDISVSKGDRVVVAPEPIPIEMNQSLGGESGISQSTGNRTITKTTKTTTTCKTVKSSQRIESFEQIDLNSPDTTEVSVVKKSESNEAQSSSSQLVEEEKIKSPTTASGGDFMACLVDPSFEPSKASKVSTMQETYHIDQKASTQTIVRQNDKEHEHQSVVCQSEHAAVNAMKKEDYNGEPVKESPAKEGISVTVSTETRLIEINDGDKNESGAPEDRQSIVTGILSLSESGLRTRQTANALEMVECVHEKTEGFAEIDVVKDLKKGAQGLHCETRKSLEGGKIDLTEIKVQASEENKTDSFASVPETAHIIGKMDDEDIHEAAVCVKMPEISKAPDRKEAVVPPIDPSEQVVEKKIEEELSIDLTSKSIDGKFEDKTLLEVPEVDAIETEHEVQQNTVPITEATMESAVKSKPTEEIVDISIPEIKDTVVEELVEKIIELPSSEIEPTAAISEVINIVEVQNEPLPAQIISHAPILVGEIKKVEESPAKTDVANEELKGIEKIFHDLTPVYVLHKKIIHCDPPKLENVCVAEEITDEKCSKQLEPVKNELPDVTAAAKDESLQPKIKDKSTPDRDSLDTTANKAQPTKSASKDRAPMSSTKTNLSKEQSPPPKSASKPRECTAKVIDVMKKTPAKSIPHQSEIRTEPNGGEAHTTNPTAVSAVNTNSVKPKPMERIILGVEHNSDGHATVSSELQSKVKTTSESVINAAPEASKMSTSTGSGSSSTSSLASASVTAAPAVTEEKTSVIQHENTQGTFQQTYLL